MRDARGASRCFNTPPSEPGAPLVAFDRRTNSPPPPPPPDERDDAAGMAGWRARGGVDSNATTKTRTNLQIAGTACSPGRTRTSNHSVNSRALCQLSYRGIAAFYSGSCGRSTDRRPAQARLSRRRRRISVPFFSSSTVIRSSVEWMFAPPMPRTTAWIPFP